ncbi:Pimeloyl-ACP methyl ester carboxylesterase [Chitinophaga terrae (ex Kim and Jung 2007)]|uniref:Pimeloyl-ACP methyl ester carboxylesterase n=1 Tax=Chitinophaga terrae (ex Kim and Jung 2007) TaxID=408074 RepID=A0A1H3XUG6_9BACT|nr:alpha/beta hydrolase [Chitinophaga terrae (ex Kim and Jung 2007)]MDQ0105724.1 pimeloyl-ACP methyl ester carboxylesterase [Chitinophaga terrae (ex Kim and Jung 2007)]SEA03016.1 Pimeloyl-ACP methyl ester carboxylesterase [Chitinophaga terrae (ex Kim and Jung 2007)]
MSDFYLPYLNSVFHGIVDGSGKDLLICLHGFGESAAHFASLATTLGDVFTIVALDMPLHGQTLWHENRVFRKDDLQAVIDAVLKQFNFTRFSLLGYSMGGRLSLCVVELMPEKIDRLVLAAADGLKNNPWHMFVTQTSVGNWLFKYNTYHPALFFALLNTWKRLGLLNQSVYKFALHRMNEPVKRELVYNVWTNLRRMMPDKKHCKQLLARYNVFTLLVFGKYDRVIPPVLGSRFLDGTFPSRLVVLDKGHQLISAELGLIIKNNLQ